MSNLARLLALALVISGCGTSRGAGDGGGDPGGDGGGAIDSGVIPVTSVVIAPNTPADAPTRFGGPDDPSRAPTVVYPPAGALVPPNLSELEVQWTPASADLFEIAIVGASIDLKIYTVCTKVGAGCALLPDEKTWKLLSAAARGQALKVTLRGTSLAGGGVGTAPAQKLSFVDEDINGGLYYWAAASGGIYRYDFGLRGQKAESFYTPAQAGGAMCVGCHALSRNGKRIAVGLNVPGPAQMRALDVATRKTLFDVGGGFNMGGSNYEALTTDGSKIVTTEGGGLSLRDATTGAPIGASPAVPSADMPDFSPDGKLVVFARGAGMSCNFGVCSTLSVMNAGLYTVPFTGAGFGGAKMIVPGGGDNNYYPSISPDGRFVVFNRAAGDSYDNMAAKVMIVPVDGGAAIDLAATNATVGNSWPKWGTMIQHFQGETIQWITFTSRRAYGLRTPSATQLWMVPVSSGKLQAGADPGYPPFWLPFQDFSTGNHIAQWVEKVERAPCSQVDQSGCMQGEQCINGVCQPGIM